MYPIGIKDPVEVHGVLHHLQATVVAEGKVAVAVFPVVAVRLAAAEQAGDGDETKRKIFKRHID